MSHLLPQTLTTGFERLNFVGQFEIHPTCGNCHILFLKNSPPDICCPTCYKLLFKPASVNIYQRLLGKTPKPSPETVIPYLSLLSVLEDFISRPGYEVEGPDKKLFFDKDRYNLTECG